MAKSFQSLYKGNYRVVKVHGSNMEIRDYRGSISMVNVTDMKKITLMEQVADDYENLGKQGRFNKKCIPRGYIPDFDWTTIHEDQYQPIRPIKQQDPIEDTTAPAAPTEVERPPSSHLRSKPCSNRPPESRDNQNTIQLKCRDNQNAIQLKLRSTQWKLHLNVTP